MENEVYNAAINGNVAFFQDALSNDNETDVILQKTLCQNNIIHLAAQHNGYGFIDDILRGLPKQTRELLICGQNSHGNTPLHVAVEFGHEDIVFCVVSVWSQRDQLRPWRVVNSEGNTAAHVALLYGNLTTAVDLVKLDASLARVSNNSKETLLHLAIRYYFNGDTDGSETVDDLRSDTYQQVAPIPCKMDSYGREDVRAIMKILIETESLVTCCADVSGLTPLHLATSLEPAYRLPVIKAMLDSCPQAAEMLEPISGNSVLHLLANCKVSSYEECEGLMNISQVYALRNYKNNDGDTPLHIAARNHDTIMVRVLSRYCSKFGLRNKSGVSAASLVQQHDEMIIRGETRRKLTQEEHEAAKAADVAYLNQKLDYLGLDFLLSKPPTGGNILHTLITCEFDKHGINDVEEFIREAIKKYPLLLIKKDNEGHTPMHILVQKKHSLSLLDLCAKCFWKAREEAGDAGAELYYLPWRLQNVAGDTPLHIAVRAGCYDAAIKLVEFDDEVSAYVNRNKMTPLHVLCQFNTIPDNRGHQYREIEELVKVFMNASSDVAYKQDKDGVTPILAAIQRRDAFMVQKLHQLFPQSSTIDDHKGRGLWHMFVNRPFNANDDSFEDGSFQKVASKILISHHETELVEGNKRLMGIKDSDGNTALHMAILNRHFDFALFFIENALDPCVLLGVENNNGVTSYDLIGSTDHLPPEFEESLSKLGISLFGHRSLYGIPTTKTDNYANTIGVTAALLATITFTAAFTVPGGLNQATGTPLLLQNAAFQAFMVSDVVAMCLSIMVLLCLLWIMTTNSKEESMLLLDVSVFLLHLSFYATLMSFMTGVYVTTVHVAPPIAVFTLVTCSLLIMIMHKKIVLLSVVPFCVKLIIRLRLRFLKASTAKNEKPSLLPLIKSFIK